MCDDADVAYLIAQLSNIHIGGPTPGSGDRYSAALAEINAMSRAPDLVLITGDLTESGSAADWDEFLQRTAALDAPWEAIPGNHDRRIEALAGHRVLDAGPLAVVLLDTSSDVFTSDDAAWLDEALGRAAATPTIVAVHQPPFETGIWWMDCVGLAGRELMEAVVRRHPQVLKVLSGHVHRTIQAAWGSCSLWVCPSTSVAVAPDLDPAHTPAETAEPPAFSLHAFTGETFVSHVVPVGASAERSSIEAVAPDFVAWARGVQADRTSAFM